MKINELKIEAIIGKVRQMATERRENRYRVCAANGSCGYEHGICTDETIGCIFGQAFLALGVTPENMPVGGTICYVLGHHDVTHDFVELDWCRLVQGNQDRGEPWGSCVGAADRNYPQVKEAA